MPIPNHGSGCEARTYPTKCRGCASKIFVQKCNHNSTVLYNQLGAPWPRHDCRGRLGRRVSHRRSEYRSDRSRMDRYTLSPVKTDCPND